jgi:integrase/recombinase XerD
LNVHSLSKPQLLALLGAARAYRERDWLMIVVAFNHGLRASEVVALTRDSIQDGFLTVQRLKGSLKTTQELIAHAEPLLNERQPLFDYTREMLGNQRIFPISRQQFFNVMRKHGATAGLPKHLAHPHVLKHSVAQQTIVKAGIENVRQHLGHKSISSTGEYLKVSDADASAAVRGALD